MSLISRLTTWTVAQILKSADLNSEFNNIVNTLNNLDSATTRWTNVDATTFKKSGTSFNSVMQVVSGTSTTTFATTSSTFQTSNLSAAITPASTSSKILVWVSGTGVNSNPNATDAIFSIFRGSTDLGNATNGLSRISHGTDTVTMTLPVSMCFYDSPATTSATTYAVKIRSVDNATSVSFGSTPTQSIILVEIL